MSRRSPRPVATKVYQNLGEMKNFDTIQDNLPIDTTAENVTSLNLIPQGVTDNTRVGRKCTIRRITMKGYLSWDSTTMGAGTFAFAQVRLVLVLDKQANGGNPAWTDVYQAATVNSPRNLSNVNRFTVLKDWHLTPTFPCVPNTAGTGVVIVCPMAKIKFNKKVNIPLEFSSTTGAITEIRSNNLTLMAMSLIGDDTHTLSAHWRVSFTDI